MTTELEQLREQKDNAYSERVVTQSYCQCGRCSTYLHAEPGESWLEPVEPQPTGEFEVKLLGVLWCRRCAPGLMPEPAQTQTPATPDGR